jgi:methionyl-tRNA formyltransferase
VTATGHAASPGIRVAMVASDCVAARVLFHAIDRSLGVVGVIVERPVDRKVLIRGRLRRVGVVQTAGQLAFLTTVSPVLERRGRRRNAEILREADLVDRPIPEARITRTGSVNDAGSIAALRALEPDVVVVAGTRVIREDVLRAVGVPFVNLHAGITPRYRGVHGGYWALAEGRRDDAGATIHLVDAGIDTGAILARVRIAPTAGDSFATYFTLQLAAGVPELIRVLPDVVTGHPPTLDAADGPSCLRYHPTVWTYLRHRTAGVR